MGLDFTTYSLQLLTATSLAQSSFPSFQELTYGDNWKIVLSIGYCNYTNPQNSIGYLGPYITEERLGNSWPHLQGCPSSLKTEVLCCFRLSVASATSLS